MEETLRIRLMFHDLKILSKSQRSRGLNQSWLLLNSKIATISDLASHVCRIFKIKLSCPNDLLLSMDGFVLPPFESTCILKDKDIIRVRKKDGIHMNVIEFDANPHYIHYSGVQENGHTISSDKLLAIREFEDDSGQRKRKKVKNLRAHNETANHTGSPLKPKNKRKHSDEIRGTKKKKLKASSTKPIVGSDKDEDTAEELIHLRNALDSSIEKSCFLKSSNKKDKPSTSSKGPGTLVNSQCENNFDRVSSSAKKGKRKKKLKANSTKPIVSIDKDEGTAEERIPLRNGLDSSMEKSCSLKSSIKKDKPSTSSKGPGTLVNFQCENNFDLVSSSAKKGKSQKNLQLVSLENVIISTSIAGDMSAEQNQGCFPQTNNSAKRMCRKDSQSYKVGKSDAVFASQPDECKQPNSVLMEERSVQAEDNIGVNACKLHGNDSGTKVQSRSARRRKVRRQWVREMKSQQVQNTQAQTPPDVNHKEAPEHPKIGPDTETENEIVPLVIRPGHIRFQSLDEEQGQPQPQTQETMETIQWKGTTSKKKGQKWGQETGGSKWNEANGYEAQYDTQENGGNCNNANGYKEEYNRKANECIDANGSDDECNRKAISEKGNTGSGPIDFDSLFPLTRIPQVGDVLAYRLIELSSSWCPEVSSFRVGQVASYDYLSMSIVLVPVPEYPIFTNEDIEVADPIILEANSSQYNEDGSLQIHYPSLFDVRLFKASDLSATASEREMIPEEAAPENNREPAVIGSNASYTVTQPTENEEVVVSGWEEIRQALKEKKKELMKKDCPSKTGACAGWSYKALRRSAMGPTLAYLRENNDKASL